MPNVVYYSSKIHNDAKINFTTTEKEFLTVVFVLDKFRSYLLDSNVVVFTDYSVLKYLISEKDAVLHLIR